MKYTAVDPIIEKWIKTHSLTLYKSYQDSEVCSVDLVDAKGRCYHIWVDTPVGKYIAVHAWDYRTRKRNWDVKIRDLDGCLENALSTVKEWFRD